MATMKLDGGDGTRAAWAERITAAWLQTLHGILKTGRLLAKAKAALPHGAFTEMIERDLPFGARTAQRLMAIAACERLSNPTHVSHLPPYWGTLYELTKLPDALFQAGLSTGEINPEMERHEVSRLLERGRIDDLDPPPRPVRVLVTEVPNPPIRVIVHEVKETPAPLIVRVQEVIETPAPRKPWWQAADAPVEPPKVVTFPVAPGRTEAAQATGAASQHGPALDLTRTTDPAEIAQIIFEHLGRDRANAVALRLAKLVEGFDRDAERQ
jgi:hypothetical protein